MSSRFPVPGALKALALVALVGVFPHGCGGGDDEPLVGHDLLRVGPVELLGQPAPIVARLGEQWGGRDGGGWNPVGLRHGDEVYVPALWQSPKLVFPDVLPADRTLRVKVMGPTPADDVKGKHRRPLELEIYLNEHLLHQDDALSSEPTELSLETTAEQWLVGDNVLRFKTDRAIRVTPKGPERPKRFGVGVFWVTVGDERVASYDPREPRLTLEPGTAAQFVWEPVGPASLRIGGKPPRSGQLLLDVRLRGPNERDFAPSELGARPIVAKDGEWPVLRLPYAEDAVLFLELSYESDDDRPLVLDALALADKERAPGLPIVFVSIDTLTARHLSTYGYGRTTSPNLERFAAEAIVFENCRSNAPITLPSYMSQLSGLYPSPRFDGDEVEPALRFEMLKLAESRFTIAEALKAVGYRTGAWVDNPWLMPSNGFAQGFDHYGTGAMSLNARWDSQGGVEHVTRQALAWLDGLPDDMPYFAFLQALDVHGPYVATEPFKGRFAEAPTLVEDEVLPVIYGRADTFGGIPDYIAKPLSDDPRPERLSAQRAIDAYDEVLAQMDHNVGVLFDGLRERGILDEAVVVFSADHGESMVEHDYYFDHGTLYDESIHVPLIVRMPGGANGGRRVKDLVQLVDLYPTFLELAGGTVPTWLHGRSLVPVLHGGALDEPRPVFSTEGIMAQASVVMDRWKLLVTRPLYGAHPQTILSHPFFERTGLPQPRDENGELLRNQRLKNYFIQTPGFLDTLKQAYKDTSVELFDLRADPLELKNVAKQHPEEVKRLRELLQLSLKQARSTSDGVVAGGSTGAEMAKTLRNLGYTGDDEAPRDDELPKEDEAP